MAILAKRYINIKEMTFAILRWLDNILCFLFRHFIMQTDMSAHFKNNTGNILYWWRVFMSMVLHGPAPACLIGAVLFLFRQTRTLYNPTE